MSTASFQNKMTSPYNTDHEKVAETLKEYCEELTQEKFQIAIQLKLARNRIEELEEEVKNLKSAIESI